jgi:drug/metabolite transporter (DMT)-like permease
LRGTSTEKGPFGLTDLMLLGLVLVWGVNFSVVKRTLDEMSPLSFNALRFALATTLILILLRASGETLKVPRQDWGRLLLLGLIGNTTYQLLFINGLARTTASHSSLLLSTTPIFVALLSTALGIERVRGLAWLGIFLCFGGISLIVQGSGEGLGLASQTLGGDLLTLAATTCWATYTVFSKPMLERYSPLKLTTLTMMMGTVVLFLLSLPELARQDWGLVSWQGWLGLIYSFSLAIALGYVVWYTGVSRIGAARTAVYSNLIPVVGVATAWLALGERLVPLQIAGAAVVLVGIYVTRFNRKEK